MAEANRRVTTNLMGLSEMVASSVPRGASRIMGAVASAGGHAWLVGGCIRDIAAGMSPRDWDIVTNLTTDGICQLVEEEGMRIAGMGERHGTVLVVSDDGTYDVSTLRHGGEASAESELDELLGDLSTRDFTVNSCAWSEHDGIIDPNGGLGDLSAGVLRCVGNPHVRLYEDPLRILRALRLSVTMGLEIDGRLSSAIHALRVTLARDSVASERVFGELRRILVAEDAGRLRDVLLDYRDVMFEVIPELRDGDGMDQVTKWHRLPVYEHIVEVVAGVPADLDTRLAALLHDVGKPACMTVDGSGVMHFYGHPGTGAELAEGILRRIRCDEGTARRVIRLVRHHDDRPSPSRRGVSRLMRRLGDRDAYEKWLSLYHADVMGQSDYAQDHSIPEISRIRTISDMMEKEDCPIRVGNLAISGHDVMAAGVSQGPDVGAVLDALLDEVMAGNVANEHDALVSEVERMVSSMLEGKDFTGDEEHVACPEEASQEEAVPQNTGGGDTASTAERRLRGVSLYTGAGGMDVGFERAGVDVVWANELVSDFAKTYEKNHPDGNMHVGDINGMLDMLDGMEDIDVMFGGAPCQSFSIAGKMDPNDERGKLVFTFLDAVERVKPRAFVMENVKALGEMRRWEKVRAKYLQRAADLGYVCRRFTLSASDYGVPQKRERTFFIGIRSDVCDGIDFEDEMRTLLEGNRKTGRTVRDVIGDLGISGTETNPNTCPARITFAKHPIMRSTPYAGMYFNGQGRPVDLDGLANTLPASMGGNRTPIIDEMWLTGKATENWVKGYHAGLMAGMSPRTGEAPSRLRRLTIREVMRIQTFPDDYEFVGSPTSIYRQLGNAVPCDFAEAVGKAVVSYLAERDDSGGKDS